MESHRQSLAGKKTICIKQKHVDDDDDGKNSGNQFRKVSSSYPVFESVKSKTQYYVCQIRLNVLSASVEGKLFNVVFSSRGFLIRNQSIIFWSHVVSSPEYHHLPALLKAFRTNKLPHSSRSDRNSSGIDSTAIVLGAKIGDTGNAEFMALERNKMSRIPLGCQSLFLIQFHSGVQQTIEPMEFSFSLFK